MTAILQALNSGHAPQKILKYLAEHNPQLASQISSALQAGHSIDHVINFLSKNEKKLGQLIPPKKERNLNPFKEAQVRLISSIERSCKSCRNSNSRIRSWICNIKGYSKYSAKRNDC